MAKMITALFAGILLGALAMLFVSNIESGEREPRGPVRDLVKAPAMTPDAVERHREERYRNLSSVEEILALPTEFARAEALYALAGRSGSAAVQALVFEADRIADDVERVQLLSILFVRLTEIDPQSALALARTEQFRSVKAIERTVWRSWAREDFDDALFAAKAQTSIVYQKTAAQSLYAAFGYMGNDATDRIEAELGIGPDRSTRAKYLYRLADNSPAEAIAFINGVTNESRKNQYVSWLAYYLSLSSPAEALRHAALFESDAHTKYFERIVKNSLASENPRATIERIIASGRSLGSDSEFHSAITALARTDLEAVLLYFGQIRSVDGKRRIGSAIAVEMARQDPDAALAWAQENEVELYPFLQLSALSAVAWRDPERAMEEAFALPNSEIRSQLVAKVVQQVSRTSPIEAVAYLDHIQDAEQRRKASQQILYSWMRRDARAAVDWILSQDEEAAIDMLRMTHRVLVDNDIDTAIRILPGLEQQTGNQLKLQIAEQLAISRGTAASQDFIRQFAEEEGYDQLRTAVIAGVAQSDTYLARQLADQMPAGVARDSAYASVISKHAKVNPGEAARWISRMAAGATRDDAILHLASLWDRASPEQQSMIDSIGDPNKRIRAKMNQIYSVIRTNPNRARELLEDEDISALDRQRIESMLNRSGRRF